MIRTQNSQQYLLGTRGHLGCEIVGENLQLPVRHLHQLLARQKAAHL
jgi:hypothetical protein